MGEDRPDCGFGRNQFWNKISFWLNFASVLASPVTFRVTTLGLFYRKQNDKYRINTWVGFARRGKLSSEFRFSIYFKTNLIIV